MFCFLFQEGVGNVFTSTGTSCESYVKAYCQQAHNTPTVVTEEKGGVTTTKLSFSEAADPGCKSGLVPGEAGTFTVYSFTSTSAD